jgi:hypothetical protein
VRWLEVRVSSVTPARVRVIAPVIVPSHDGRRVSWIDFLDYTGVFDGPIAESADGGAGRPWDPPDLHFGREQYIAEIERASRDGSSPTWGEDGVALSFERRASRFGVRRQVLRLTSTFDNADQAAQDMVERLLSTSPGDWTDSFGRHQA